MRNRALRLALAVLPVVLSSTTGLADARTLTTEARIEAQRAIEEVYWRHRTWPEANRAPKPSFSAVISDATLRSRVEDYLRKSNALAGVWGRPIASKQLQAEMERMARESKSPDVLAELFAALGKEPGLIAETLVRQKLVERRIRDAYAFDDRFHGAVRRSAERAISLAKNFADLKTRGDEYRETTWRLEDPAESPAERELDGNDVRRTINLDREQWDRQLRDLAGKVDRPSRLEETADAFEATAVLSAKAGEVTTATVSWRKTSLDEWWSTERERHGTSLAEGVGIYSAVRPSESGCVDDTWRKTFYAGPLGITKHTAVWTGTEMLIWGFDDGPSGGRYDPSTDTWTTMSGAGVPSGRNFHTSVWTGTEMIIWGGDNGLNTGGRYNPSTDTWMATSTAAGVPAGRESHTAVWTGTEMIVWGGGLSPSSPLNTGGRYNPLTDTWVPTSTGAGVPSARQSHTAVWNGTVMIVWGGTNGPSQLGTGGRYDPSSNIWTATSTGPDLPSARYLHTAVWTGTEMIVWGGWGGPELSTGGRYNPSTDTWSPTSTGAGVPSARYGHTAVWTGTKMIVWGGSTGDNTGGRYDPSTNTWTTTSTGAGVPTSASGHSAVWTGTEMIVCVGKTGGRYDPSTNTWIAMSAGAGVPSARYYHTAVWTGAEMIVWGGWPEVNTGGRYDPSTDTWMTMSTGAGVPPARWQHTAVWTGTEMIVWGGSGQNSGGRYNPSTNTWSATSTGAGVPPARSDHTAVWTGAEMIVWGGSGRNSGGRYNPSTNTWAATSTDTNVPQGRERHTAVWTGTRMIVWGGLLNAFTATNTGGRYDPSTDTWEPTSTGAGVPTAHGNPEAVWTGTEMIVPRGGRYDPESNTWAPISLAGIPDRGAYAAVWSGTEMIVWGGGSGVSRFNDGGRYHPPSDTWVLTSTGVGVPTARANHTAVWTGREMIVWGGDGPTTATGSRYCASARCTGSPGICDDGDACTSSTCDLGTGLCVKTNTPKPDGTPCSDGITCTDGETCTAGVCGGGTPSAPGELQNVRFVGETRLVWDAISDSPRYDVLRGHLSALPVGPGGGDEFCVDELSIASFDDGTPVSPGTGFWYVTRGSNACGVGSYGTQRDATPRMSTTCP